MANNAAASASTGQGMHDKEHEHDESAFVVAKKRGVKRPAVDDDESESGEDDSDSVSAGDSDDEAEEEWTMTYRTRALLARLKIDTDNRGKRVPKTLAKEVKFFTRHFQPSPADASDDIDDDGEVSISTFQMMKFDPNFVFNLTEKRFMIAVTQECGHQFDHSLTITKRRHWRKIFKQLENRFSKTEIGWRCKSTRAVKGTEDAKSLIKAMTAAFADGLTNGPGKYFLDCLFKMYEDESEVVTFHLDPVVSSHMVGRIQLIPHDDQVSWDSDWKADPSSLLETASMSSTVSSGCGIDYKKPRRVPDYVWCLRDEFPGFFIIDVEVKRNCDDLFDAIAQCIEQMLTQMHFQSSHFGLVITPFSWVLLLLHKHTDTSEVSINAMYKWFTLEDNETFNVESFVCLCNWLYRIMKFRTKNFPL